MPTKPTTIDEYLKPLPPAQRKALQKLRTLIHTTVPEATENVKYGIPVFELHGILVGFGAAASHCSFFPTNADTVATFAPKLTAFDCSKGTIRFQPGKPIPAALVRAMVKHRLAYNLTKRPARPRAAAATAQHDPAVAALMRELKHPLKSDIEATRAAILAAHSSISEAIKWKAPSFRTTEFFATIHIRTRDQVQVILHRGAKPTTAPAMALPPDPKGLLKQLDPNRCLASLGKGTALASNLPAFRKIIKAWIKSV